MTSDGIRKSDWIHVHEIALRIANAAIKGDDRTIQISQRDLMVQLEQLERKYGRRPSILATRADFSSNKRHKVKWWKDAYKLAEERKDKTNLLLIADSLAGFMIEEKRDSKQVAKWLRVMKEHLSSKTVSERRRYRELSSELKRMEKLKV